MLGKPSTMLWPGFAAIAIAATWVLPNHHLPWRVFHQDAWMILCALCLGMWMLWKCGPRHAWHLSAVIVVACALIPFLQWKAGLLATSGQAIISSAYVLALGLAMVMGQQVQRTHRNLLLHCLFAAIAIASIANVGLQLFQWFAIYDENLLSLVGFIVTPLSIDTRPSGNILQPNQLATLLIWGLMAGFWGYVHRTIRPAVLCLYLVYLGLGIAITQSRIGLIEIMGLCIAAWYWRSLLPNPKAVYYCFAFAAMIFAMYFALPYVSTLLNLEYTGRNHATLAQDGIRLTGYRIYIDALLVHPWFGYGLSHLGNAYFELAQTQPLQSIYFLHSHNILLDVLLWFGIPIGSFVVLAIIFWFNQVLRQLVNVEQALLLMMVITLGLHALVELPHQFCYFLVPVGIAIGSINHSLPARHSWQVPQSIMGILVIGSVVLWFAIVHDYLLAEDHYTELRFEQQHVGRALGHPVPELLVLNQLQYMMEMQRLSPTPGLSAERLNWMRSAARAEISGIAYFALIGSLALNDHRQEAVQCMYKLNAMSTSIGLKMIYKQWSELQLQYPQIADMAWIPPRLAPQNP
jgi:Virulence factor membrane-bound polymerase, C-terminal/O-Antigen ligase/Protein glycosylation ligase